MKKTGKCSDIHDHNLPNTSSENFSLADITGSTGKSCVDICETSDSIAYSETPEEVLWHNGDRRKEEKESDDRPETRKVVACFTCHAMTPLGPPPAVCMHCNSEMLWTSTPNSYGRYFSVGQQIYFRSKEQVPSEGIIVQIVPRQSNSSIISGGAVVPSFETVRVRYVDKCWSDSKYDEIVLQSAIGFNGEELAQSLGKRRRAPTNNTSSSSCQIATEDGHKPTSITSLKKKKSSSESQSVAVDLKSGSVSSRRGSAINKSTTSVKTSQGKRNLESDPDINRTPTQNRNKDLLKPSKEIRFVSTITCSRMTDGEPESGNQFSKLHMSPEPPLLSPEAPLIAIRNNTNLDRCLYRLRRSSKKSPTVHAKFTKLSEIAHFEKRWSTWSHSHRRLLFLIISSVPQCTENCSSLCIKKETAEQNIHNFIMNYSGLDINSTDEQIAIAFVALKSALSTVDIGDLYSLCYLFGIVQVYTLSENICSIHSEPKFRYYAYKIIE